MPRLLLALVALLAIPAAAQSLPFTVEVVERTQANAPALHSGAVAHHGGDWLFVTGRTDGIHPMINPTSAFPHEFSNGAIVVYEPATDTRWTAPLSSLPADVERSLRVTNPQFHQEGETLYVAGGYGVNTAGAYVTFNTLTAIDVPGMIEAVRTGGAIAPHLRQTSADFLAVTGGHLVREASGRYVIAGGHRYNGRYLGPDEDQVYTDALRRFTISDDGTTLSVEEFAEEVDAARFHRRDGNIAPFALPNGETGFALYGGVFTPLTLPYRTPVIVMPTGTVEMPFETRFGHYTTPVLPMITAEGDMHTVFFGGMNLFKVNNTTGAVTQDSSVPFTDDVTSFMIAADGVMEETILPLVLPGLLGTNAHLVPADGLPRTSNGVLRLDELTGRTRVGTIHGGIEADIEHPAFTGAHLTASRASARTLDVYVTAQPVSDEPGAPARVLALSEALPNPTDGAASFALTLASPANVRAEAFDALGRRVAVLHEGALPAGAHRLVLADGLAAGVYVVRATAGGEALARRVVVR